MTDLTTQMQTELSKPAFVGFGAVEIVLPSGAVRFLDGAGQATFNGHTFLGRDPTFGVLAGVTEYADGVDNEAPSLTLTMLPPSNSAMATLADPAAQGSQVTIWEGAIDPVSGQVIPDPDLCMIGEIDVPTQRVAQNTRALELTVISIFDRFLEIDEGQRLNSGFQQSVWPGELGLQYVTTVQYQMPWGADAPRPALVTDVKMPTAYRIPNLPFGL